MAVNSPTRGCATSQTIGVLLLSLMTACGGGAGPTGGDAGGDSSVDAATDGMTSDSGGLCVSDDDCDDGLFCNGVERCLPDDVSADVDGCVPAEADACLAEQTCDEDGDRCQTMCDLDGDADGDGHDSVDCGGDDCDDADANRYPGNVEVCDGHDEDCDPTTLGSDGDGDADGHLRLTCCNPQTDGSSLCGDDCNDTESTINPEALEVCDGDVDNDCNGLADSADGVCVPCPAGFRGFDTSCTNIDECAEGAPCVGAVGATCADTDGSYTCTCPAGYSGAGVGAGGTCADDDECASVSTCGSGSCSNTVGSYTCSCDSGYSAPATGGTCVNVNECATATTCGVGRAGCVDTVGSYRCTCQSGFTAPPAGGTCSDIDECASVSTCGPGSCSNTVGSYTCACDSGYSAPATGGTCSDIDECVSGTDDCDSDPVASCANSTGGFTCTCGAPFTGTGHGATGCRLPDARLSALVPSVGSLQPGFAPDTFNYTLTLSPGETSVAFTPSVLYPTHATIRVNGVVVASGSPSAAIATTAVVMPLSITVTTDDGTSLSYTVVVRRSSTYIKASNTDMSDSFGGVWGPGASLALSSDGTTLAVQAYQEDSNATGVDGNQANNSATHAGAVYIFTRSGGAWSQQAYIKASNTGAGDSFGSALSLSDDGSTLAVGADGEASNATGVGGNQVDNSASYAGAVYVFTRSGSTWSQRAYVKASNTDAYDAFGVALQLSGDGSTLAVGADGEASNATGVGGNQADNSSGWAGAVYVFTGGGGTWSQQAYIKASNTDASDRFGHALGLSDDGSTLVVGAYREGSNATGVGGNQANNSATQAGAAYVFTRSGTSWSQQAYIKASNTDGSDEFGRFVALSGDGSTIAVGAQKEGSIATGIGGNEADNSAGAAGAVYVFTRSGATWSQQAYVKASNTGSADWFGVVALSDDGSTLVVGARADESNATGIGGDQANNSAIDAGAAYVFTRSGSTWSQLAYLKASNTNPNDQFGQSAAVSGDGSIIAIGAPAEASNATGVGGNQADNSASTAGAVYVF
ncbi:MAG: hypothetical protein GXP55_17285 [Deltaproteobacteria bacterium]|nr:hypothetical protein [Deltaproteobacteria bacterium]